MVGARLGGTSVRRHVSPLTPKQAADFAGELETDYVQALRALAKLRAELFAIFVFWLPFSIFLC